MQADCSLWKASSARLGLALARRGGDCLAMPVDFLVIAAEAHCARPEPGDDARALLGRGLRVLGDLERGALDERVVLAHQAVGERGRLASHVAHDAAQRHRGPRGLGRAAAEK